jgi:Zn-dependent protease with chaperone function
MSVRGYFYEAGRSQRHTAELQLAGRAMRVLAQGREVVPPIELEQVNISSRIGNTPRSILFPTGVKFETPDNAGLDQLLSRAGVAHGRAHRLESRLRYALLGLVAVALFVWGLLQYGIPALAKAAAFSLPPSVNAQVGRGALEILDGRVFAPSHLSVQERQRLRRRFSRFAAGVSSDIPTHVIFRDAGKSIGANALALPSGTIIFTDQLVRLAHNDEELVAVLAHEMGHVAKRHGMRQTIQGSALGMLSVLIFGDVSSVSSAVAALPVLLTRLGYSRQFEREADAFAVNALRRQNISLSYFSDILLRLEKRNGCARKGEAGADCEQADKRRGGLGGYLSTHPPTRERLEFIGKQNGGEGN